MSSIVTRWNYKTKMVFKPFLIKLFFGRPFRYDFMTKCWKDDPNLRPSYEKLRNKLKEMEKQHKVEW